MHRNRCRHRGGRPVGRGDLQVDQGQLLYELCRPVQHRAVGKDHHRAPVEHQVVLAADQVDVGQRRTNLGSPAADHPDAHVVLVPLVGRRVRHQQHIDLAGQRRHGSAGLPDVLAHHDADVDAPPADHGGLGARREPALLVEHPVVGQVVLVVAGDDRAAVDHRRRVPGAGGVPCRLV